MEVQAQASGRLPQHMQLLVQRQGQPDRRYPMEPLGHGAFRYTFLKPQASLTFQATADGFRSAVGTLEVVPAPAIGHMALQYLFPDYTGLPGRTQEGGGDIQALPGTQVHLSMRANVPLTRGVLRFDAGYEVPLAINGQELRGEMLVMREGHVYRRGGGYAWLEKPTGTAVHDPDRAGSGTQGDHPSASGRCWKWTK